MQRESVRVHNVIDLGVLDFEVVSYRVDHVKTVSSYYTMSNDTKLYTNGIKPIVLTLTGYFPKAKGNGVVLSLEGLLKGSQSVSFELNSIQFRDLTLSKYSFKEQVSSVYQECEMVFMGVTSLEATTEVSSDE